MFGGEGGNCRAGGNAGIGDGMFDGGGLGRQLLTSVWAATSLAATLLPSEAVLVMTAAQKRTRPMARALVVIATIFHRRSAVACWRLTETPEERSRSRQ